ncbi:hypothetical protein J6S88_03810 [bacterium]|nr:hypothetical protein [bacterium]
MKIIPIINTEIKNNACKGGNVSQNSAYIYLSVLNKPIIDTVCFGVAPQGMSAKSFKKLYRYMVDLYSAGDMLSDAMLNKMKKRGFFKGSISEVVSKLRPYKEKYLEPMELKVFEVIEKEACKTPDITITELFNGLFYKSLKEIEHEQKPLFDHMRALGGELPADYAKKFAEYMAIVDKKVKGEPIQREFSKKEFIYKLTKLANGVTDNSLKTMIKNVIACFEGNVQENKIKQIFRRLFHMKPDNPQLTDALKVKMLDELMETASSKGHKRIARLCDDSIKMLSGVPVYVPFSNKAFTYDITKILNDLPETRAKIEIMATARALPNSASSIDALILKFRDSEPNLIGDRLFSPSLVSVEHLLPQSEGGATNIANCALARRGPNSRRGSEPLHITLQKFPKKNQQKYVNRLIMLVKRGLMHPEDALAQIETIEQLGHISLNKSKLLRIIQEY